MRVAVPLAAALAASGRTVRTLIGPWAERVARILAAGLDVRARPVPTPLTGAHRSAGRAHLRRGPRRRPPTPGQLTLPAACATCGAPLADALRRSCDACLADARSTQLRSGPEALRRARAAGRDPGHGGAAAVARGATQAARRAGERSWQGPPGDPETFRTKVLPTIEGVSLRALRARTGLSLTYLGLVRSGAQVPHRRWWERLAGKATRPEGA